tara:strand:+ start:4355 stop:5056 length:702 start_codon:yes stop_codon:yes gene_type:complete
MNVNTTKKLLLLSVLIFVSQKIMATDCSISMKFEDAIRESEEIFMGRLIKIKDVRYLDNKSGPPSVLESGWYDYELIFEVVKKWKGGKYNRVSVFIDALCPPYFLENSQEPNWFWLGFGSNKEEFFNYQYIIYATHDASRVQELVYRSTNRNYKNFDIPGYRIVSGSSFRTLGTKNLESDSLFISEIEKLDSTFTNTITLVPYYFSLKNFLIISFLGGLILYLRNKFYNYKPD